MDADLGEQGRPILGDPTLAALPVTHRIDWLSPLEAGNFAEYRNCGFLKRLGLGDPAARFKLLARARTGLGRA